MARYVTPKIGEVIEASDGNDEISLAIVPSGDDADIIRGRAAERDVTIDRELPSGVLLVTLRAKSAEEFTAASEIASVSKPDRMALVDE